MVLEYFRLQTGERAQPTDSERQTLETATRPPRRHGSGSDLSPTWPLGRPLFNQGLGDVASYITGRGGGDADGDDNLQWLPHGQHDKNQTRAPVMCQGHFRVGERGRKKGQDGSHRAPCASEMGEGRNVAVIV